MKTVQRFRSVVIVISGDLNGLQILWDFTIYGGGGGGDPEEKGYFVIALEPVR